MNKYSVRKYFYVDTVVEANSAEEANDLVNDMDVGLLDDICYLGDLEFNEPDIAEL